MTLGEFDLIDRIFKPLAAGHSAALGLVDDAAVLDPPAGCELVIAKDAMVESVHFLPDDPPDTIAGKLLRVNLSDLAAMGADPLGYLLVIARARRTDDAFLRSFAKGLARDQERFGLTLLGGDTVSTSGPLSLSLTIIGTVPKGTAIRRSGAMADDQIWVSGTLGDAAIGLRLLNGLAAPDEIGLPLIDRYRTPLPRLALGQALRGLATAAIDVSDGLLADLGHIAEASGLAGEIEAAALPLSAEGKSIPGARMSALTGGDDYELLFTVPSERAGELKDLAHEIDLPLTRIGRMSEGSGVTVRDEDGNPIKAGPSGWQHF